MRLIDCILNIPELLQVKVSNYDKVKNQLLSYIKDKKINEIVFVASGTSYNAANVTSYFSLNKCGIRTRCIYPNIFINSDNYINENALYVFISQGGITRLVFDSLKMIKDKKILNCSITEDLNSPIAKLADFSIEMGSDNEEYIYRTIGYSTTVATCCIIEMILAVNNGKLSFDDEKSLLNDLYDSTLNIKELIEKSLVWYENNKFSLIRRSKCIFAGSDYLYQVANEADIKFMEMIPMFTRSFEIEELIHGPQNAFDDNTIFFLLADENHDVKKTKAIKSFISNEIGFCSLVGNYSVDGRDMYFNFKSCNFRFIEIITFFRGIKNGVKGFISLHKAMYLNA